MEQKTNPYYSSFADSCRILGIWDDHDYGLNDGGKEFEAKKASKNQLFAFLDIPENDPSRLHEGVYQSYTIEEQGVSIKVILLDTRYFRGDLIPDPSGQKRYLEASKESILGEAQWAWLEKELKTSMADFHLIGSGIQVIPTEHGFEKWANFPNERKRLVKLLEQYDPPGTILISGDRHIAEISQLKTSMKQGTLTEVTSSGLTHAYEQASSEKEPNAFRLGELYPEKNYSILSFYDGTEKAIEIQLWGMKQNLLTQHKLIFPAD
jgi:alkaline phosphatase D